MVTLPKFVFILQAFSYYLFALYILVLILLFPAWLIRIRGTKTSPPMPFVLGLEYFIAGPYLTLISILWRFFLHRLLTILVLIITSIGLILPFGVLIRALKSLFMTTVSFSNRLWEENINIEQRLVTKTRQTNQSTRGGIEQALMRLAYIPLLRKGKAARRFNLMGLGSAIPTVLAAIAQDQKDITVRLAAIDTLGEEGYADELLVIAKDPLRPGEIVSRAAETLETRPEWQPMALEAWTFLLEHQEAPVRLRAANHLKLSANPAVQGKAITCLRSLLLNEVIRLDHRIEAAAALGRVGKLGQEDLELLEGWMNDSPDPAARLHAAFSLACLGNQDTALGKLRRYCYEYQHTDALRLQAIEYLGRLDRTHDLRPLSHMTWVRSEHRMRAAEIMYENGHHEDAAKSWLELTLDIKTPPQIRQKALQNTANTAITGKSQVISRLLTDALFKLGGEGETSRIVRLEAARAMVRLGLIEQARQIFLVLSLGNHPETAVRRQAVRELHNLALQTF